MFLTLRSATVQDLDACSYLILDRDDYDEPTRRQLVAFWSHLVTCNLCSTAVIEDRRRSLGSRCVGFGISAFTTEAFIQEAQTLPPNIGWQVMERWRQGMSPILEREARRQANSGDGVSLLVLHYGWADQGLDANEQRLVRGKLLDGFFFFHTGYNLKEILHPTTGQTELRRAMTAGFVLREDYGGYYQANALPQPLSDRRPYLIGLTRQESLAAEASPVYLLFLYTPPRFYFTPREQEILQHALMAETDEELALALGLSVWTVKKRWADVYTRIHGIDPELLPQTPNEGATPRRGCERRRHLLQYLRQHPEELRPVLSPEH